VTGEVELAPGPRTRPAAARTSTPQRAPCGGRAPGAAPRLPHAACALRRCGPASASRYPYRGRPPRYRPCSRVWAANRGADPDAGPGDLPLRRQPQHGHRLLVMLGCQVGPPTRLGQPQLDLVVLEQRGHRRVLGTVERPLVLADHDRVPAPPGSASAAISAAACGQRAHASARLWPMSKTPPRWPRARGRGPPPAPAPAGLASPAAMTPSSDPVHPRLETSGVPENHLRNLKPAQDSIRAYPASRNSAQSVLRRPSAEPP
jgi:hypothetical protein